MIKKKIILDCDPGHDDAVAIMLAAASDKIQILGITCVAGNTTLENSKFWADRFHAFGLSAKDLENQKLSPTQIPLKPQDYSETRQSFNL